MGLQGVYAAEGTVIVVNLLRLHTIAGKDLKAVSPASPTDPGSVLLESRDGRHVKVMFIPSVRPPARQRAYEFIASIRIDAR